LRTIISCGYAGWIAYSAIFVLNTYFTTHRSSSLKSNPSLSLSNFKEIAHPVVLLISKLFNQPIHITSKITLEIEDNMII